MSGSGTRPGLHIFYIMNIGQYVRWEWAKAERDFCVPSRGLVILDMTRKHDINSVG